MNFIPRLSVDSPTQMRGNPWWYSTGNIFYPDYGLPNCTCYAYGRYAEIRGAFASLPGGNAGTWWNTVSSDFEKGQTPRLGAIACWRDANNLFAGHVGVVEVIKPNMDIITSNSAWNRQDYYFYTQTFTADTNYKCYYHSTQGGNYVFQGFIYNDEVAPVNNINVIAAIAGCFAIESTVNPGIWETLIPSQFDHEYEYDGIGGYGLGQWTNVGTSHGRLWNLYQYALANSADPSDGGIQLKFMLEENYWANSPDSRGDYNTLQDFLESDESAELEDLVWDFMINWEGVNTRYEDRVDAAEDYLDYILEHLTDDPKDYLWISKNEYLTLGEQYNNVMCLYFWLIGDAPLPPRRIRKGMPVWMMCKYKRRF